MRLKLKPIRKFYKKLKRYIGRSKNKKRDDSPSSLDNLGYLKSQIRFMLSVESDELAAIKILGKNHLIWQRRASNFLMIEHIYRPLRNEKFAFLDYDYDHREVLYEKVADLSGLDHINFYEFGVFEGVSLKKWSDILTGPKTQFFGFDSFTGLPEDWTGSTAKKGAFNVDGRTPEFDSDSRVKFVVGLFNNTIPSFLASHFDKDPSNAERTKILHLDADLYSSTLYVLAKFDPYLKAGDFLVFDEFAHPPHHEFQAFYDWTKAFGRNYTIVASRRGCHKIAMRLK